MEMVDFVRAQFHFELENLLYTYGVLSLYFFFFFFFFSKTYLKSSHNKLLWHEEWELISHNATTEHGMMRVSSLMLPV